MTLQVYQRYVPGQQIGDFSSHRLQNAADEIRQAGNINTGPGLQLSKTPSGTSIRLDNTRPVPRGMVSRLLYVKEVRDNTLVCGSVSGGGDLEIAKPLDLQLQDYNGKVRTFVNEEGDTLRASYSGVEARRGIQRSVVVQGTNLSTSVQEMITPPYAFAESVSDAVTDNSRIIAVLVGDSKTGVVGSPFIDWNNAGRAWAEAKIEGGQP